MILVLTHRHGFEADRVLDLLRDRDVPYFRLNTEPAAEACEYELVLGPATEECYLHGDGRTCRMSDVRVAWYQQPPPTQPPGSGLDSIRCSSYAATLAAVIARLSCPWLNEPHAATTASNKFSQLCAAKAVGLAIPETLVSNRPAAVRVFAGTQKESVIKTIGSQWQRVDDELKVSFTQPLQSSWLENHDDLSFAPVLYQEFLPRVRDFRVVVVGGAVFAAVCDNQAPQQKYDVRLADDIPAYRSATLSADITTGLAKMLQLAGLDYCSADLFETRDGRIVFVDLNVSGAWWWMDRLYDGQIAASLTTLLMHKAGYG